MAIAFSFTVTQDFVTSRGHATIMREVNRGLMEHIRDQFLKRHFADNASTRPGGAYGYAPRNAKYTARKQAKFGHADPNRLTGRLARTLKRTAAITATQNRGRLRMTGYFPLTEERRSELQAVSRGEQVELATRAVDEYARKVTQPRFRRRRRRRS